MLCVNVWERSREQFQSLQVPVCVINAVTGILRPSGFKGTVESRSKLKFKGHSDTAASPTMSIAVSMESRDKFLWLVEIENKYNLWMVGSFQDKYLGSALMTNCRI